MDPTLNVNMRKISTSQVSPHKVLHLHNNIGPCDILIHQLDTRTAFINGMVNHKAHIQDLA